MRWRRRAPAPLRLLRCRMTQANRVSSRLPARYAVGGRVCGFRHGLHLDATDRREHKSMSTDSMSTDAKEAELLRKSFEQVQSDFDRFSTDFYDALFRRAPELRSLFRDDLAGQGMKFMTTLREVILHTLDGAPVGSPEPAGDRRSGHRRPGDRQDAPRRAAPINAAGFVVPLTPTRPVTQSGCRMPRDPPTACAGMPMGRARSCA